MAPNKLMMRYTILPNRGLRVTGEDRLAFLQGQMTNDLRGSDMVSAAFLDPRGRVEHFARIYKREHDIYISCESDREVLEARFRRYIIFDQVTIETVPVRTIHLWNETDGAALGWQIDGGDVQQWVHEGATLLAARVNRTGREGLDLHFLESDEASLSLPPPTSLTELDHARIHAGLPDPARDHFLGYLLPEIGLDVGGALPSISYRKGCYVGQEIMARLEARGNVRYELRLLKADNLPSHTPIFSGDREVGVTGLSTGTTALARLKKGMTGEMSVGEARFCV